MGETVRFLSVSILIVCMLTRTPTLRVHFFTTPNTGLHRRRRCNIGGLDGREESEDPRVGHQLHRERRWVVVGHFCGKKVDLLERAE